MSDTSVHTILSAITEAKSALDREPEYKARIAELESSLSQRGQHIEGLEVNAHNYKRQIEELTAKVRSLEVERDDASFRGLELEDKVASLYNDTCKAIGILQYRLDATKPPQPEPEEIKPTVVAEPTFNEVKEAANVGSSYVPETIATEPCPSHGGDPNLPAQPPHPIEAVGEPSVNVLEPYKGKRYSEVFVSSTIGCNYSEWIAGGGSDYDYFV